jgi:hypothetical protein
VEEHRNELLKSAIAYLNVDTAVSGPYFRADATPSLSNVVRSALQMVGIKPTFIGQLGSGSDFVGFVDNAGVPSVNFHFTGPYGVYHSNYDSFNWMVKFGDPTFSYVSSIYFNNIQTNNYSMRLLQTYGE